MNAEREREIAASDVQVLCMPFEMDGRTELRLMALDAAGQMVGTASVLNVGRRAATVYQLFVVESARRRGVGSRLLEECVKRAAAGGSQNVSVLVRDGGPVTWYVKRGFEPVHHEGEQTLMALRV